MTYAPWMGRKIGVELELSTRARAGGSLTLDGIARAMRERFIADGLNASTIRSCGGWASSTNGASWDVKTDGSCGYEIASRAITLDERGENAELRAACETLGSLGKVTSDCGLHVHIDVSDFDRAAFQRLLALWYRYEPFFYGMVAPSRSQNTYCPATRSTSWTSNTSRRWDEAQAHRALNATSDREMESALSALGHWGEKYQGMNIRPYPLSGRIEFRLHHGTLNYGKVRRWAMWLLALVGRAKAGHLPAIRKQVPRPFPVDGTLAEGFNPSRVAVGLGLFARGSNGTAPQHFADEALTSEMVSWANERRLAFRREARAPRLSRRAGSF